MKENKKESVENENDNISKKTQNNDKNTEICELKSKIDEISKELELSKKLVEEQKTTINNYLSTAAYYKNELENQKKDFERYKDRNKNIELDAKQKATEDLVKKILPVIDNFDQAMLHLEPEIMKGFMMIYSSLLNILSDLDVVEIDTSEQVLDPELHNCISTEETNDEKLDGKIASVYQKGYKFAGSNKVVRPATVTVYKIN